MATGSGGNPFAYANIGPVPRLFPTSPLGLALTAFHLWRRLPPAHRRQVMNMARVHGPKVAAAVLARRKAKP
jgi:hypothetical protein